MDPNQINHMTSAFAGMMGFFLFFGLFVTAFFVFVYWRILAKAGLPGPLSFLVLIPGIGWLIVLLILAFSNWRVVPVPSLYPGLQPYPPPPPGYPPPPPPASYKPPPPAL